MSAATLSDVVAELSRAATELVEARKALAHAKVRGVETKVVENRLLAAEATHLVASIVVCEHWKSNQWQAMRDERELAKLQEKYGAVAQAVLR